MKKNIVKTSVHHLEKNSIVFVKYLIRTRGIVILGFLG